MTTQGRVGQEHRERVLTLLRDGRQATRRQIADELGIARSTVSDVLSDLLDEGAVVVARQDRGRQGRGRPAELLSIDPAASHFMGVEFTHLRVFVVVVNASRDVIASGQRDYPSGTTWRERLKAAFDLGNSLAGQAGVHFSTLQGVAVGLPGRNSAGWDELVIDSSATAYGRVAENIAEAFQARYGTPVLVDHHIRYAALAESFWEHPTASNLIYLRLSHGVGGALVTHGQPVHGVRGMAGELGHVIVDRSPDARLCRCGRRGCLESIASVDAIVESCQAAGLDVATIDDVALATRRDGSQTAAAAAIDRAVMAVGQVLAAAVTIADPAEIVLGGELAVAVPNLSERVQASLARECFAPEELPTVRITRLGDEAAALGGVAAWLAKSSGRSVSSRWVPAPRAERKAQHVSAAF